MGSVWSYKLSCCKAEDGLDITLCRPNILSVNTISEKVSLKMEKKENIFTVTPCGVWQCAKKMFSSCCYCRQFAEQMIVLFLYTLLLESVLVSFF